MGAKRSRQRRATADSEPVEAERDLGRRFAAGDVDAMPELRARCSGPIYTGAMSRLRACQNRSSVAAFLARRAS
ncbi:MAG: hypothetical protein ACRD2C_00835 [Acidimicrobiales bacterium]